MMKHVQVIEVGILVWMGFVEEEIIGLVGDGVLFWIEEFGWESVGCVVVGCYL